MKYISLFLLLTTFLTACETLHPVIVNNQNSTKNEFVTRGNYVEFPKDSKRMPYWYKDLNEEAVKVKTVDFLTVEDLLEVKIGMTLNEVVNLVGKKPFDIVYNQNDGYNVVKYYYKKIYKIVTDKVELEVKNNSSPKNLELGYDFETTYLMFNKYGKLDMIISEGNMQKGMQLLEFTKHTYNQTLNEGKLFINPKSKSEFIDFGIEKRDSSLIKIPIKK